MICDGGCDPQVACHCSVQERSAHYNDPVTFGVVEGSLDLKLKLKRWDSIEGATVCVFVHTSFVVHSLLASTYELPGLAEACCKLAIKFTSGEGVVMYCL